MRSMLSRFALCAVLVCGNALAQEAAPAADAAPVAAEAAAEAPVAAEATAAAAPVAVATAAAATMPAGKIGAPQEGKGQVVFFREKKFAGSAIRYKVREGETELGKLSSGTFFVVPVEPGTHEYVVHSEAKDVLTLEVEAGETYYVIGGISMGFMVGHPNLSPSDQKTFDAMSGKLKSAQ